MLLCQDCEGLGQQLYYRIAASLPVLQEHTRNGFSQPGAPASHSSTSGGGHVQTEPLRAGCTGLRPARLRVAPRTGMPQPLWNILKGGFCRRLIFWQKNNCSAFWKSTPANCGKPSMLCCLFISLKKKKSNTPFLFINELFPQHDFSLSLICTSFADHTLQILFQNNTQSLPRNFTFW